MKNKNEKIQLKLTKGNEVCTQHELVRIRAETDYQFALFLQVHECFPAPGKRMDCQPEV